MTDKTLFEEHIEKILGKQKGKVFIRGGRGQGKRQYYDAINKHFAGRSFVQELKDCQKIIDMTVYDECKEMAFENGSTIKLSGDDGEAYKGSEND